MSTWRNADHKISHLVFMRPCRQSNNQTFFFSLVLRMRCCTLPIAIIIFFYSFFFRVRTRSFDEFFFRSISNIIIENGQPSRWSCWRMWQKPFSYLKSLLVSHGTHVRWAGAHAIPAFTRKLLTHPIPLDIASVWLFGVARHTLQFQCRIFGECAMCLPMWCIVCPLFSRCTFHSN